MQSRYKIMIFVTVLLGLGILTLRYSSNDNAALSFWPVFADHAISNLQPALSFVIGGASLWYGAFSLFAIIMIVLVCRVVRRHDFQRHEGRSLATAAANVELARSRPSKPATAKAGAGNPIRPELQRMTELLHEKDATITDLENSLCTKQELLQNRSKESDELKSKVNALTEQLTDFRLAKERAENTLQRELKKTKFLQTKDSIIAGLENNLTETQKRLQERSQELDALKFQMNALTQQLTDFRLAKERAENMLERELKKTKFFDKTDSVIPEPNEGSSARVHALEHELNEKQELLQTRSRELKAARSKVNTLRERLTDLSTAKNRAETVLRQQLKKKTELLQARNATVKELQETLSAKGYSLEAQLEEKQELVAGGVKDAESADSEGPSSSPIKKRARTLLLQELQKRAELLEAKEVLVKELQEQLNATAYALEDARSELKKLATERDASGLTKNRPANERGEGLSLRSDRKGMNSQLLELGSAKARAAGSLQSDEAKGIVEGTDEDIFLTNKIEKLRTNSGTD